MGPQQPPGPHLPPAQGPAAADEGQLIGFDGLGTVVYDYDITNPGKTTVWATSPVVTLTWDGLGDAEWAAAYPVPPNNSHWLDGGAPTTAYPDDDPPGVLAHAIINANTVTVAADRQAVNLEVNGGGVAIAAGTTLTLLGT